jgi:Tol biopolymer transport system component
MDFFVGQTISRYRIGNELGRGGMGVVYGAEDTDLGQKVAVKFLPEVCAQDRVALERMKQEALAASALDHPNICGALEFGEWEGQPFIVMEMLEGEVLSQRIAGQSLAFTEVLRIGIQVADALDTAHAAGLVHRDLHPANIFITRHGQAKVLNFGLAEVLALAAHDQSPHADQRALPAAGTGSGLATVAYFSPEQARGEEIDLRTDLFRLGSLLYEMAVGRPAFSGATTEQIFDAILHQQPLPPSRLNPLVIEKFDEFIFKALEKDPELRYQSAADMRSELRRLRRDWETERVTLARAAVVEPRLPLAATSQLSADSGLTPSPVGTGSKPDRGRRGLWIAALLAAGLALGAVAVRLLWHAPRPLPLVFHPLTFRRGTLYSARFGSDSQTIFYTAAWDGGPPQVFTVRPEAPDSHPLALNQARILAVSSRGELALLLNAQQSGRFEFSGTLARLPPGSGSPRPVQADVGSADWAPDGSGLAIVRRVAGFDRLEYPIGNVLYRTAGWIGYPRFSAHGDSLAFMDHPAQESDTGSVDVVDLAGHVKTLSAGWLSARGVAWSPRGDEIWFTATRQAARQLYAVSLSGQSRQVAAMAGSLMLADVALNGKALLIREEERTGILAATRGQTAERDLSWFDWSQLSDFSADGKKVLFEEGGVGGGINGAIFLRGADGSPAIRLGEGKALALSPDGKWVLAESSPATHQLTLLPTGTGQPVRLPPTNLSHVWAAWLPDNKRFVFLGSRAGSGLQLFAEDVAGGSPRSISPEGISAAGAVSPNGKFVAAVGPGGKGYMYPVDGGAIPTISKLTANDRPIGWGGGGETLYVEEEASPGKIDSLNIASGTRTLFWQLAPIDSAGISSIGPIRISHDEKLCVYSYTRTLSELFLAQGLQ